ncbi:hypothetical protein B5M09_001056 [Aphanomyces astaci]|uniref:Uncharacterized protein n=1 Tax=Aphanomyces astaci TaxID=112090 RepID=A0A425D3M3_APHAT|nr:hypothetical protein B5M09_001056 [Aphanomyces astaci]
MTHMVAGKMDLRTMVETTIDTLSDKSTVAWDKAQLLLVKVFKPSLVPRHAYGRKDALKLLYARSSTGDDVFIQEKPCQRDPRPGVSGEPRPSLSTFLICLGSLCVPIGLFTRIDIVMSNMSLQYITVFFITIVQSGGNPVDCAITHLKRHHFPNGFPRGPINDLHQPHDMAASAVVLVLCGLPGAGKSSFCRALASHCQSNDTMSIEWICYDDIFDASRGHDNEKFDPSTWRDLRMAVVDRVQSSLRRESNRRNVVHCLDTRLRRLVGSILHEETAQAKAVRAKELNAAKDFILDRCRTETKHGQTEDVAATVDDFAMAFLHLVDI